MYIEQNFGSLTYDLGDIPADKVQIIIKEEGASRQQLQEAELRATGAKIRATQAETAKAEAEQETERWIKRFEGVSQRATDQLSSLRDAEKQAERWKEKYERLVDRIASNVSSYETKRHFAGEQGDLMGQALHDARMRAAQELLPQVESEEYVTFSLWNSAAS